MMKSLIVKSALVTAIYKPG